MSGAESVSLLLKLGARGSMLCCRVEWGQALDQHDITAEVRSTSSGQLLMKGLMAKVMTYTCKLVQCVVQLCLSCNVCCCALSWVCMTVESFMALVTCSFTCRLV